MRQGKPQEYMSAEDRNWRDLTRALIFFMIVVGIMILALVAGMIVTMFYDVGLIPHPFFTGALS